MTTELPAGYALLKAGDPVDIDCIYLSCTTGRWDKWKDLYESNNSTLRPGDPWQPKFYTQFARPIKTTPQGNSLAFLTQERG